MNELQKELIELYDCDRKTHWNRETSIPIKYIPKDKIRYSNYWEKYYIDIEGTDRGEELCILETDLDLDSESFSIPNGHHIISDLFEENKNEDWVFDGNQINEFSNKKIQYFKNNFTQGFDGTYCGKGTYELKFFLPKGIFFIEKKFENWYDGITGIGVTKGSLYKLILIGDEKLSRINKDGWFSKKEYFFNVKSIILNQKGFIGGDTYGRPQQYDYVVENISLRKLKKLRILSDGITFDDNGEGTKSSKGKQKTPEINISLNENERKFFQEYISLVEKEVKRRINRINEIQRELDSVLSSKLDKVLSQFDSDNNGIIDIVESNDDFNQIFKKHQKDIIKIDKTYIQHFVKISNYLKTKKENIQLIFEELKKSKNEDILDDQLGLLQNQINTFKVTHLHSISMVVSLVDEDLITFYEIYVCFDKLNMFSSNWEKEVVDNLGNISSKLNQVLFSINKLETSITREFQKLQYITDSSFKSLNNSITEQLKSINSNTKFNNLLNDTSSYRFHNVRNPDKFLL